MTCLDARSEVDANLFGRSEQPRSLEKRARELADINLSSGKLKVTPKDYYSSGQLEKGEAGPKWDEAWVDFKSANLADAEAELSKTKPQQPVGVPKKKYITEHILEVGTLSTI